MVDEPSNGTAADSAVLEDGVAILSKKWTVSVVQVLLESEPLGFSDLERQIGDVSGKVLSDCLDRLQAEGIVDRRVLREEPLRVEYTLTAKGRGLEPVVDALGTWASDYLGAATPTVLLVDDDQRLVEMHAEWLDDYTVQTATDGKTARERLDEAVDVLVADRRMPELSGDELAQYVAASDVTCGVVFLSSVNVDEDLLDLEFDAYVQKPTTPEELTAVIEDALARQGQASEYCEFESLRTRLELFESALSEDILERSDSYQALLGRAFELEQQLDVEPIAAGESR